MPGAEIGHLVLGADTDSTDPRQDAALLKFEAALLTRSALRNLPAAEPLIDNTLDQGTVALLYGRWGCYKSFLSLDWALSVATGRPWQGRPTEQRSALYVAAEGAHGYRARVDAWEIGWGQTVTDDVFRMLPLPVNLTTPEDVAALAELVYTGQYGMVVVDTLARCMVGADENSARDCGEVVDALVQLRRATPGGRGVVLGVHHTGKDGKTFRGSSVFEAGADTVYGMQRDGNTVTVSREKRKDGPEGDEHRLRLDLIDGTDSGVLSAVGAHQTVGERDRNSALLVSVFADRFTITGANGGELRRAAEEHGLKGGSYDRARNDLLKDGRLVNTGTQFRPHYEAGTGG